MRAGPARMGALGPPRRRIRTVRGRHERGRLLGSRLGLDRPVDDPAEVNDGDLHDHHQPDQLPHYGSSVPLNSACNLGLELSLDQLLSVPVVLRHLEGRTRPARLHPAGGCDPHRVAPRALRRSRCTCPGRRRPTARPRPARPMRRQAAGLSGRGKGRRGAGRATSRRQGARPGCHTTAACARLPHRCHRHTRTASCGRRLRTSGFRRGRRSAPRPRRRWGSPPPPAGSS